MPRLNMLDALESLYLPKELHYNAYKFLYNLEDPYGQYYNPHAAEIIRKLLFAITHNKDENYVVLFLGQIESLLLATREIFDTDNYLAIMQGLMKDDPTVFKGVTKAKFQETIDSLLYGRKERNIYAIENYYPKVSLIDRSSSLMIHTSVMLYLKNTPDTEQRRRKYEYLSRKANDRSLGTENCMICSRLADYLKKHIDDKETEGGESFDRMFRKLTEGIDTRIIDACIKARNTAVHEGRQNCDNHILGFFFVILLHSPAAAPPDDNANATDKTEERIRIEMARDIRNKRLTTAVSTVISATFIGAVLYFLSMAVVAVFIGESDIQRVRWESSNSQFNARINEIIATKDTAQLLEVQKDLKWIQESIRQSELNN